jgi:molybdopterin molybdotransferase
VAIEHIASAECAGPLSGRPLLAERTQPATALSAMDGYALRQADMPGPWTVSAKALRAIRSPGRRAG